MPAPSSQSPASSSPSLKRKQPSIATFFGKKPSQPSPGTAEPKQEPQKTEPERPVADKKADKKKPSPEEEEEDDEDDEIVAPAPKRARTNGSQSRYTARDAGKEDSPAAEPAPAPANGSQRTDLSKFTSSPAVESASQENGDNESKQRQKERGKLHEKFVKKLGGPDCLIGIGSNTASEAIATEDAAEDEDEEPARPAPAKGKAAAKKGGSKLTPLEKQVIEIKRKHMDTILVVEVGYKFRFFGEDARTAAKELSIVCIPGKFRYDERMYYYLEYYEKIANQLQIQIPRKHISTVSHPRVSPCIDCMCT